MPGGEIAKLHSFVRSNSEACLSFMIDRASAISGGPLDVEDLKIIVLMVFWSLGEEPDALILDELFVAEEDRLIH